MIDSPLWISEAEVERLLDPQALVAAVAAGWRDCEAGIVAEAGSTRLDGLDGGGAYMSLYPSHARGGFAAAKALAGRPANAASGRLEIDAVVALIGPEAGRIVALIAARALTALRTAAASATVLRRLLPPRPSRIALVGTGAQARAHGRILAAIGLVSGFQVASPRGDGEKAGAFAAALIAATGVQSEARALSDVAEGADALILMSLAQKPLDLGRLPRDLAIVGVGPFYPHAHELAPDLVAKAAFVVSDDPRRLRRQWAGSALLDVARLTLASAADVAAGAAAPGRGHRVFLSDGRAFQDNVAATMIYRAALAAGAGLRLP